MSLLMVLACLGASHAFAPAALPLKLAGAAAPTLGRGRSCSLSMGVERGDVIKGVVPALLAGAGAAPAFAMKKKPVDKGDGKWANHLGEFTDEEISEGFTTTASGLKYKQVQEGTGAQPRTGNTVTTHYSGYLLSNGALFDSSYDRRKPLSFKVGQGQVIKAWDEALLDMKIGSKRILVIPPELGYGERGAGGGLIPAGATLVFYVELVGVAP
uniref:peptidylprolyl isomerase n=1 Tax=Hemiselmis tepida TaxID=464990 RepID=A0A7S0VJW6_9CRYP